MKKLENSSNIKKHFLLLLFYTELYKKKNFFGKHILLENLVCTITFLLQFFCVKNYLKCSNETPTPIQNFIGLVEAVLRPKILDSRLNILTQKLKAFHILEKCLISLMPNKSKSMCQGMCLLTRELFSKLNISQRYAKNMLKELKKFCVYQSSQFC